MLLVVPRHPTRGPFPRLIATAVIAMFAFASSIGAATVASDIAVKSAFLFNFAKFTEWPSIPASTPIALCIFGDSKIADALADTVRGQNLNGHPLNVWQPVDNSTWPYCHLLFVADAELRRSIGGLSQIKEMPVLTIGDGKGFAQANGIIEFYVADGRMRFTINVDAVQRSRLRLSSRLLGLATIIRDGPVQQSRDVAPPAAGQPVEGFNPLSRAGQFTESKGVRASL